MFRLQETVLISDSLTCTYVQVWARLYGKKTWQLSIQQVSPLHDINFIQEMIDKVLYNLALVSPLTRVAKSFKFTAANHYHQPENGRGVIFSFSPPPTTYNLFSRHVTFKCLFTWFHETNLKLSSNIEKSTSKELDESTLLFNFTLGEKVTYKKQKCFDD